VDASEYPSLGRLARLNAQLAVQAARVEAVVAAQLDAVERLFRAATNRDWDAVGRASRELASQPANRDNSALVQSAGKLCEALRLDPSGSKAARPLAKLLDACRAAKKNPA
jgi:hypothetical protein